MATKKSSTAKSGKADRPKARPRSAAYFDRELCTHVDVIAASWAVCSDLANAAFSAGVGNAIGKSVGNVLKTVELTMKYGQANGSNQKVLQIANGANG